MKNNQTKTSVSKLQIRDVAADPFFNGTQNIPIENSIAETDADFARLQEQVRRESSEKVKDLEGRRGIARHRRAEAETRWQLWKAETGDIVPPVAAPFGKVAAAFAMMMGEAILLAPLMDLFGVPDLMFQFVLASVIVIVLALLVELPVYFWRRNFNRYAVYAVGTLVSFGLISLGVFRAFGLKAIESKSSPLISGFLGDNSLLSALVIAFLTAALPIGACFAFETGWHGLRHWRQWRKARRDALKFAKADETITKKHEAAVETRDKRIAELEEQRAAWIAAKRQAHDEGSRLGARRKPFWEISIVLFGGCFLITAMTLLFAYIFCDASLNEFITSDAGRFTLYFGFALGLTSIFSYYILKRWNSPTAAQLYADRTVVWRGDEHSPKQIETVSFMNPDTTESASPKIAETVRANGKFA